MNKKISIGAAISIAAILIAIACILTWKYSENVFNSKVNIKERDELSEIESYVKANYSGLIDDEVLENAMSKGYIEGLNNNNAEYYTKEEYAQKKMSEEGQIVGLGFTPEKDESGYIRLSNVQEGSPAANNELVNGDLIVEVDKEDVLAKGYVASVAALSGGEGVPVSITIRREGVNTEYQLIRTKMDIKCVKSNMLENNIGYIRIETFNAKTAGQFEIDSENLINKGAKGIVIDIRDNSEGTLDACREVLNYMVPAQNLALGNYGNGSSEVILKTEGLNEIKLPISVIVNNKTKGIAEVFAAALRDAGKAVIVGTNTYGDGILKKTQELTSGAAVTIPVGTIELSRSGSFDTVGIKPNFEVTLSAIEEENKWNLNGIIDAQIRKSIEVIEAG